MSDHKQASCQAALIAAPSSKQGKTIFTVALARLYCQQGKRVQVFKLGPDYLDPTILEQASGQQVYNLDVWMMGEAHCRNLLAQAADCNDVILVESAMGLHDNSPSNAQVAKLFDLPVVLIMNVAKFAQTTKAIVEGLEQYGEGIQIHAVIGNLVGSDNHHRLMVEAMGESYAGSIRWCEAMQLPERYLGLVQAQEITQLNDQLNIAANVLDQSELQLPLSAVQFEKSIFPSVPSLLEGKLIAIAKDAAFSFIYPNNLVILQQLGAQAVYFSPMKNEPLPECDALWLPGGYPELHLAALGEAQLTKRSIEHHIEIEKPILAECGGMMALCQSITDTEGNTFDTFGLFGARAQMCTRFQSIGLQSIEYPAGVLRGHSFHHSKLNADVQTALLTTKQDGSIGESIFQINKTTLSYMHHYFASNYEATAALFS